MKTALLIYGLIDPRTRLIRYIGKSCSGMRRPNKHRQLYSKSVEPHCKNWIRSLLANSLDYEIAALATANAKNKLSELECFWISYGHAFGWPLTNATAGGEGRSAGYQATLETRAKMSAARRGTKRSDAVRAKFAEIRRAFYAGHPEEIDKLRKRVFTPEWRAKISARLRGRIITPEWRAKSSAAKRAGSIKETV